MIEQSRVDRQQREIRLLELQLQELVLVQGCAQSRRKLALMRLLEERRSAATCRTW